MIVAQPPFLLARINKTLQQWFAGDRSPKTFNGSNVSVWGNLGVGDDAPQATASEQPLYVEDSLNGIAGLEIDGIESFDLAAGNLGSGNQKYNFTMVQSTVGGGTFLLTLGSGDDTRIFFRDNAGTFNTGWFNNNLTVGTIPADTFQILTSTYDQVGREHFINGASVGSDTETTLNQNGAFALQIGANDVNRIEMEHHVFLDELTADEQHWVNVYYSTKYGIALV